MRTKIIEATNGFNWGKFLLGEFDHEWQVQSAVDEGRALLSALGWTPSARHVWVLDLQTGEGAHFPVRERGHARSDLNKHRIWVCPLYEPFLAWLYAQAAVPLDELPTLVNLPEAESAMYGYRRQGS